MRAIVISETGSPDVLRLNDVPKPSPGSGQILIRVDAAGINFGETMQRAGTYPMPLSLPATPGSEVAGVVEAVGSDVQGFKAGDRVAAMLIDDHGMWANGGYAEFAVADAARTIALPDAVTAEQAVALFGQGLTAWFMLTAARKVTSETTVLVHAAAGGVGSLAVQIAELLGASQVFGTAGTAKHDFVTSLGATPIDYAQHDWPDAVKAATGGRGVDIILDPLGGAATVRSLAALAPMGTLIFFGSLSGAMPELSPMDWGGVIFGNQSIRGFANMAYTADPQSTHQAVAAMLAHVADGAIRIDVTRFPLDRAADAHRAIEARETMGKVVLVP